jgi:hypothetical protein
VGSKVETHGCLAWAAYMEAHVRALDLGANLAECNIDCSSHLGTQLDGSDVCCMWEVLPEYLHGSRLQTNARDTNFYSLATSHGTDTILHPHLHTYLLLVSSCRTMHV